MDSIKLAIKIQQIIDEGEKRQAEWEELEKNDPEGAKRKAIKILQHCGVLDKKGEITEKYKGIVVKNNDNAILNDDLQQ